MQPREAEGRLMDKKDEMHRELYEPILPSSTLSSMSTLSTSFAHHQAATQIMSMNCSSLELRSGFADYIAKVDDVTGGDITLISQCKSEVCIAMWGNGNADISGVGVSAL